MDSTVGTDSQDSDDLVPPGLTTTEYDKTKIAMPKQSLVTTPTSSPGSSKSMGIGIQNAKKKLRAFSIQKKSTITAASVPKPVNTGSATVLIGKLSSVKTTPKPDKDVDAEKKPPKPPKPGSYRGNVQGSYTALQKRTLCEIEDMKRKMELVELGIPLGLICPSSTSEKAMPTKAMPPIKSFLDPSKVDELIREAKKAKAAGKEFKFDYQKLLPDYDNPFQRKRDDMYVFEKEKREEDYTPSTMSDSRKDDFDSSERRKSEKRYDKKYDKREDREKDKHRKPSRWEDKRDDREKEKHRDDPDKYKWEDKSDDREKDKPREESNKYKHKEESAKYKHREETEKYKERGETEKNKPKEKEELKKDEPKKGSKETDVILSEYVVCDSWSLDNEDKPISSPQVDKAIKPPEKEDPLKQAEKFRDNLIKKESKSADSPVNKPKIEKLKPVIDAFKFDIDPNEEDDALEMFDEEVSIDKFPKSQMKKDCIYDSPDLKLFDYDQDMSKDIIDANDDNFLESVINEIKQENMSDDTSQDNNTRAGLVEYDSPKEDDEEFKNASRCSVTPELDDRMRDLQSSQQSHYSDGYRSTESGYKSTESGYKSTESYKSDYKAKDNSRRVESRQSNSFRCSEEQDLDSGLERKMARSTVDSLETWSFVLKICQPLLFRHDKNKCYKETYTTPKLWYTTNPKSCNCVKDRSVVYEELEMCKMALVDRVYGCDQIPDAPHSTVRAWYPRVGCAGDLSNDWETDEPPRSTTPTRDMGLDQEYQRFIESVWPDVAETKPETRSTTPDKSVRQESRKKKKAEDGDKDAEDKKKAKKMKLSSEGWSQESDLEEGVEKTKKIKTEKEKIRKRKHSTSSSDSDSEVDTKKKKKMKKKDSKKSKAALAKKRRVSKKIKKKLKEKQKKKRKIEKINVDTVRAEKDKKKEKKLKKKTQMKAKKTQKKKKAKPVSSSSSSSSDSSSSTDSELEEQKKKIKKKELLLKKKKKDKKKKKRKESSESTQSEDLFDVNILKNIKTERLTDDEKNQNLNDFSPRRQKTTTKEREIINVKELQNDFVGNNIHIKQEKEDIVKEAAPATLMEKSVETPATETNTEQRIADGSESAEKKAESGDSKAKISVSPEPLSPDIPFPEESEIPLPEEMKTAHSNTPQEQRTIHLTADSNIPLPAEIKTQNIPEPPPQIVEKKVTAKTPCVEIKTACVEIKTPCVEIETPRVETQTTCVEIQTSCVEHEQISSYSYTDVSASQSELYGKGVEDSEDKFVDGYEQENYDMYEQMAMAYQSDVANQVSSTEQSGQARPIETVVRRRRGEIKCDWRAADNPATAPTAAATSATRPSRWGLKPGEVNIVLTGGPSTEPAPEPVAAPTVEQYPVVYKIQSLANRHDTSNTSIGYDEAYQVTYGAADRLQYGDCFGDTETEPTNQEAQNQATPAVSSLDERINRVLQETALGDAAKDTEVDGVDREVPEKGILITKSLGLSDPRNGKRVSFADGYKPGQDSDTEEPPVKRKKKVRRYGCAWPCPATHPDHVPLWDALPPPPPPRSPPPPPAAEPPPLHLLRPPPQRMAPMQLKQDAAMSLPSFMPPEPPPGMISFQ